MGGPGSGAKPRIYDPQLVESVAHMYASGMTQTEIAQHLNMTQKVIFNVMRRSGIKARVAAKRNQSGPTNHMWKGATASYKAFHLRVANARGTPSQCERCGRTDNEVVYEWASLTGDYADINDYERMCRSCHRQYDASRR